MISIYVFPHTETLCDPWSVSLCNHPSPKLPFSRNLICVQIFYLKRPFLHHFCSAHLANPCQQWQEAHFRGGPAGPSTPVVLAVNMRCQTCAALPTGCQLEGQLCLRGRLLLVIRRALGCPLILLFIFSFGLCEALAQGWGLREWGARGKPFYTAAICC